MPASWQAVANGVEVTRQEAPRNRLRVRYAETEPIPTYLFAFAAGRFQIESAERNGRTFRMFHRETDARKVARNRDAIFDLHAAALRWLETYTAIPYPFGKFDFVLVPSFQFGGMEHPGAIFYNAGSVLLDESATENQMLGRASLIAHETAHMWFGDLVTMRWFNDVWMKEVFANFMAAKIVNPSFPKVNHELRFLVSNYPAAYAVDRTAGTHPIRQELANLNEAGSLYGAIIYQKAPIVMRQLERLMGAEELQEGLRAYLKRVCVRQCDVARSRARAGRADARAISPRGAVSGSRKLAGPQFGRRSKPAPRVDRLAWHSFSAIRRVAGRCVGRSKSRCWSAPFTARDPFQSSSRAIARASTSPRTGSSCCRLAEASHTARSSWIDRAAHFSWDTSTS